MNKINVLVLAAGKGSRFKNYTNIPKPFIDVKGVPMFLHALSFLNISNPVNVHVLFQKSMLYKFDIPKDIKVHTINHFTEGAAESAYYVIKNYKDSAWLILDCDAVIQTNKLTLDESCILVESQSEFDPRASYSYIDNNQILCTAEKQVISNNRNVGMYFWSSGKIFCDSFEYAKTIQYKVNNEYYISPLYNIAIQKGEKVIPKYVNKFIPIGVPEDLEQAKRKLVYE